MFIALTDLLSRRPDARPQPTGGAHAQHEELHGLNIRIIRTDADSGTSFQRPVFIESVVGLKGRFRQNEKCHLFVLVSYQTV